MKAVIVDLQGQSAAALCEDGTFIEVTDMGYIPGQTIELTLLENEAARETLPQASLDPVTDWKDSALSGEEPAAAEKIQAAGGTIPETVGTITAGTLNQAVEGTVAAGTVNQEADRPIKTNISKSAGTARGRRLRKIRFSRIAAAAAACFLVLGISAGTVWAMPYGKVYVDNGSSIEYTINRFDYVLDVEAGDETGKELLEELDLKKIKNKKIDRAVAETLEQIGTVGTENSTGQTSNPAESRDIEILTDIKNEKHAKNLQERLDKIASDSAASMQEKENGSGDSGNGTPADEILGNTPSGTEPEDNNGGGDQNHGNFNPGIPDGNPAEQAKDNTSVGTPSGEVPAAPQGNDQAAQPADHKENDQTAQPADHQAPTDSAVDNSDGTSLTPSAEQDAGSAPDSTPTGQGTVNTQDTAPTGQGSGQSCDSPPNEAPTEPSSDGQPVSGTSGQSIDGDSVPNKAGTQEGGGHSQSGHSGDNPGGNQGNPPR